MKPYRNAQGSERQRACGTAMIPCSAALFAAAILFAASVFGALTTGVSSDPTRSALLVLAVAIGAVFIFSLTGPAAHRTRGGIRVPVPRGGRRLPRRRR